MLLPLYKIYLFWQKKTRKKHPIPHLQPSSSISPAPSARFSPISSRKERKAKEKIKGKREKSKNEEGYSLPFFPFTSSFFSCIAPCPP